MAAIAVPLALALLSKLYPPATPAPTGMSEDELTAKYRKWTYMMAVVMLIVVPPLTLLFWVTFKTLADWCAAALPPADMTFAPIFPVYWGIPAIFLAISCAGFAAMAFVQWRLGDRYGEFLAFWSLSSKMDPIKANKLVLGLCAGLCIILVALGVRPYVQLRDNVLVVQGFLPLTERHLPLAQIQSIRTSARFIGPNGKMVLRREYIITFSHDHRWTTDSLASDPDEATKRALMVELSRRSGVPIEEVDHFASGELR